MSKTDNGHVDIKADLRRTFTAHLSPSAKVLECFAGFGGMYTAVWSRFPRGVCVDRKEDAAKHNAERRPTWACYAGDSIKLMQSSFYASTMFDVVDFDCYGSPWPIFRAWCDHERARAQKTVVFLTDGYGSRASIAPPCKALWGDGAKRMSISRDIYLARVQRQIRAWTEAAGLCVERAERWEGGTGTDYMALVIVVPTTAQPASR